MNAPGYFINMEARKFKVENYITVPGFAIVELGLSGNELLCYSLINGFNQDGETEFHGSLNYVASALNVTKQNAKKIIDRLIERGLIEKREIYFSGVKFCHYVANRHGVAEIATGGGQNSNGGVAEIATIDNNKDISIDIDNKAADGGLFPTEPGATIVTRPRRTSEALCLFENSRYANYDVFAQQFKGDEFANVDLVYYYHAVADWSAQRGKKMKDWIATTRNFIRGDIERGKLHKIGAANSGNALSPDALEYLEQMAQGL